jgi:hypothetical protein
MYNALIVVNPFDFIRPLGRPVYDESVGFHKEIVKEAIHHTHGFLWESMTFKLPVRENTDYWLELDTAKHADGKFDLTIRGVHEIKVSEDSSKYEYSWTKKIVAAKDEKFIRKFQSAVDKFADLAASKETSFIKDFEDFQRNIKTQKQN